jgi:hypothetical protein
MGLGVYGTDAGHNSTVVIGALENRDELIAICSLELARANRD